MDDNMQNHHIHGEPDSGTGHKMQRPYWKRAHRDWRTWVAAALTLAGMITYAMTDDFSLRFRSRPPVSFGK